MYQFKGGECFFRDRRRIAANVHPVAVRKTPIATTKVITTTKAMTVGTAAAIADGFLSRINVHFNCLSSAAPSSLVTNSLLGSDPYRLSKNAHLDRHPTYSELANKPNGSVSPEEIGGMELKEVSYLAQISQRLSVILQAAVHADREECVCAPSGWSEQD